MKTPQLSAHTSHRDVCMLLPWYVNGTLEGAEVDLVQEHLRICITCRREVAEQRRLAEVINRSGVTDVAPHTSFARLTERIDRERLQANRCKMGWSGLRPRWARLSDVRLPRPAWILAPLLLLLAVLAPATRLWLFSTPQEPQYHTLASPNSVPAADSNEIRVVFAKTIDPEQVRQLLLSLHLEIVPEPSATGAYTVRIAASDPSDEERLATLDRLRHHPGVLLAEPTEPALPPDRSPGGGR